MTDTKEKILTTALGLFAQKGYDAVSVSTIAGKLGITKGALYKHYKNKRDIFDSIVERMYQIDAERSREYKVPEERYEDDPHACEHIAMENIRSFSVAQFSFWTEDIFASNFRKMLTLEQYRSSEMGELYRSCISEGPAAYMEDIFRMMIENGYLREADPKLLAVEFYAPLHLLISISDHADHKEKYIDLLNKHIDRFIQLNTFGSI